jgi:hypothetical protein
VDAVTLEVLRDVGLAGDSAGTPRLSSSVTEGLQICTTWRPSTLELQHRGGGVLAQLLCPGLEVKPVHHGDFVMPDKVGGRGMLQGAGRE